MPDPTERSLHPTRATTAGTQREKVARALRAAERRRSERVASAPEFDETLSMLRRLSDTRKLERLRSELTAFGSRLDDLEQASDGSSTADEATRRIAAAYADALLDTHYLRESLVELGVDISAQLEPRAAAAASLMTANLTPREAHVRELLAAGLSNADIAHELRLTRNTVKTHVANVLRKLNATSRIDVIRDFVEG